MDRLAAASRRATARILDAIEIALARRGGTDADRLVGKAHVQRVAVGLGVDGDGAQAQPARGADDAAGDFAAVGNQDALEHGRPHILKMPKGVSPSSGRQVEAASASASTLRVSAGSITPSSQSRALA